MRTATFNLALLLDCFAFVTPPCLYGLGACVLLGKVWTLPGGVGAGVLAAAAAVIWVGAAAYFYCRSARFTQEQALAWLDWRNAAGGTILAGDAEVPLRVVPALSLRPLLRRLPIPVVFVLAALLAPPLPAAVRRGTARVEPALNRLLEEVDASEETGALAETEAEELRRQIAQIHRLAEEHPEAAAEAVASLPERLDVARAERLEAAAEAVEQAMAARDAAREGEADTAAESLQPALDNLARAEGGWQNLPEEVRREAESGGAGAAGEALDRLLEALERHAESAGGDAKASRAQAGAGGAEQAAAERLATVSEMLQEMRFAEMQAAGAGGEGGTEGIGSEGGEGGEEGAGGTEPGRGGISQGPGAAPLWFGAPSTADLEVEYLPLPRTGEEGQDLLLKRERERPDEMPEESRREAWRSAVDAPDEVRSGSAAGGIGPERERAVVRYFERLTVDE